MINTDVTRERIATIVSLGTLRTKYQAANIQSQRKTRTPAVLPSTMYHMM